MFTFRQLFDPTSSTYTYLLDDDGQALLIDRCSNRSAGMPRCCANWASPW
jgi:hypothetical protein